MTEKKPRYPTQLIKTITSASRALSEEVPQWLRPIFNVIFVILFTLIILLFLPVHCVYSLLRKEMINPFFKLRTEVETKWYEGKKEDALQEIRRVRRELTNEQGSFRFPWQKVEPYGKFDYENYAKILWLLFNWEYQQNNIEEASAVCDEVLLGYKAKTSKRSAYMDQWVVNRAKIMHKLEGGILAQEFLMQYLDPKNTDSLVNKYMDELKSA